MTIVHSLDVVAQWLADHVCSQVMLKPYKDSPQTDGYEYELVHPVVFPLYVPSTSTKPPQLEATTPSICVQIVEGTDTIDINRRRVSYHLAFASWDPGVYDADVYVPTEGASEIGPPYKQGDKHKLTKDAGGWRGVWNFVDVALREIERARALGGYPLDPSAPIKFGAYDEDGVLADYYPHWFAWVEVTTLEQLTPDDPAINDLL